MAHTYYQLLYHLVWSTKERRPLITLDSQERLHEYLGGTFRDMRCHPILINGMPDHVHVCVEIPPTTSLSDLMKNVKVSSTKWVKQHFPTSKNFEWQEGYGAFSVSPSNKEAVFAYIKNQEAHHRKYDFKEEFLLLLKNHGIQFEEKYLWK